MDFLIPLLGAFMGSGVTGFAAFWLNRRNRQDDRFEQVQLAVAEYMASAEQFEVELSVRFRDTMSIELPTDKQVQLLSRPLTAYAAALTLASSLNFPALVAAFETHRHELGERAKRNESDKSKAKTLKPARDAVLTELRNLSGS